MRLLRLAVPLLLLLSAVFAFDAQAAFPGANGRIAFDREASSGATDQIYSAQADGTGQVNLSNDPSHFDSRAVYSPDGKLIAFLRSTTFSGPGPIWLMNADGTGKHQLTAPAAGVRDDQSSFSPDGQKIVFERDAGTTELLFEINVNGTGLHQLTSPPAGFQDETPTWSPDGTKIAFMREPTDDSSGRITLINADGTGPATAITNPPSGLKDGDPNFSPDGSKIVFGRSAGDAGPAAAANVFTVNVSGTGETALTNDTTTTTENEDPAFSPDGTMIVYGRYDGSTANPFKQLFVMRADGSGKHAITPAVPNQFDNSPNWQPLTQVLSPALSGLRITPRKASVGGRLVKGKCVKRTKKNKGHKRCRRKVKLKVSYTLNKAVGVTFRLTRKVKGRKVKGRCVKPTKKNRKHKRCTKSVNVATFTRSGTTGASSFTIKRKLKPGSYVLSATPSGGAPQQVTFKVTK